MSASNLTNRQFCTYEARSSLHLSNRRSAVWITKNDRYQISSNYTKLKSLGAPGVYGQAFQFERHSDHKQFAVKEISKSGIYRLDPSHRDRIKILSDMKAEVDISQRLSHKYIINTHKIYETKHKLHIVMDECKGGQLFERIIKETHINETETKRIIGMICEALVYMHDTHHIIHGDLKADNILFLTENQDSDIKIIDFGMSKVCESGQSLSALIGSPFYTAPEIIKGSYAHSVDMWSLAITMYIMVYGFPPFHLSKTEYQSTDDRTELYKHILNGFDPTLKDGFGAWFPKKMENNLSECGRNFLSKLLEMDPSKRLSAKQALLHPWLCANKKEGIIKEGYLMKKGKVIGPWKKRKFILNSDGTMSYYGNKSNHEIVRFSVKHLTKIMCKSWGKSSAKRYGIKIYTPQRKWRLLCESECDRREWVNAIENIKQINSEN